MGFLPRFAIYALAVGLAVTVASVGATAADAAETGSSGAKPARVGSESVKDDAAVAMSVADCQRLLARMGAGGDILHRPDPGVNYQPGRDVDSQGRPIAPADLPGSNPLPLDGMIKLPIRLPLSKLSGINAPSSIASDSELRIATLGIDPMTGKLSFNGQPLESDAADAVARACRDVLARPQAH